MKELNNENYKDGIAKGNVLVDFWAEWCGPCKMLGPILEELESEIEDISFAKVNVDENEDLSTGNSVRGIPTMLLFKDGEEIDRIVGFLPKESLKQKIESSFK